MYNRIEKQMEYIQGVFMKVQNYMQENHEMHEVISFLNAEPSEFRSVAYESASMEIGLKAVAHGDQFKEWKKFYSFSKERHSAHMEVGLGWAFGKTDVAPTPYLKSLDLLMPWMVFDGMGYYYGLYKGRRTVKNKVVPEFISEEQTHGFDQGLGRRLWYIAKGDVKELVQLIQSFPLTRQRDLWRGVGIACGYVGGNEKSNLELLSIHSAGFKRQLSTGLAMAALCRNVAESVTENIGLACSVLCSKSLLEVILAETDLMKKINSNSGSLNFNWIEELETEFG